MFKKKAFFKKNDQYFERKSKKPKRTFEMPNSSGTMPSTDSGKVLVTRPNKNPEYRLHEETYDRREFEEFRRHRVNELQSQAQAQGQRSSPGLGQLLGSLQQRHWDDYATHDQELSCMTRIDQCSYEHLTPYQKRYVLHNFEYSHESMGYQRRRLRTYADY